MAPFTDGFHKDIFDTLPKVLASRTWKYLTRQLWQLRSHRQSIQCAHHDDHDDDQDDDHDDHHHCHHHEEHQGAREVGGSEGGGWLELPSTSQRAAAGPVSTTTYSTLVSTTTTGQCTLCPQCSMPSTTAMVH